MELKPFSENISHGKTEDFGVAAALKLSLKHKNILDNLVKKLVQLAKDVKTTQKLSVSEQNILDNLLKKMGSYGENYHRDVGWY